VLGWSAPGEQGFNSSAKSIADAVGSSVSLAITGLIFGAFARMGEQASFVATLTWSCVVGAATVVVAARVSGGDRSPAR
jgi:hypothetical protein